MVKETERMLSPGRAPTVSLYSYRVCRPFRGAVPWPWPKMGADSNRIPELSRSCTAPFRTPEVRGANATRTVQYVSALRRPTHVGAPLSEKSPLGFPSVSTLTLGASFTWTSTLNPRIMVCFMPSFTVPKFADRPIY